MSPALSLVRQLEDFYAAAGLAPECWHIGPEHPSLEQVAIEELQQRRGRRLLEIGVQAGGFAVPVIAACSQWPGFSYTGVDSHAFPNAVPFTLIEAFLATHGLTATFVDCDSGAFLAAASAPFDVILLDHFKPRYAPDLVRIFERQLLATDGVVLLHDVTGVGAREWPACLAVARAYGWAATIRTDVPGGLALLRPHGQPRAQAWRLIVRLVVASQWIVGSTRRRVRAVGGQVLRRVGLR